MIRGIKTSKGGWPKTPRWSDDSKQRDKAEGDAADTGGGTEEREKEAEFERISCLYRCQIRKVIGLGFNTTKSKYLKLWVIFAGAQLVAVESTEEDGLATSSAIQPKWSRRTSPSIGPRKNSNKSNSQVQAAPKVR